MNGSGSNPLPLINPCQAVLRNVTRWLEKTQATMIVVLTMRKPTVPIPLATFSDRLSMKLDPPA